MEVLLWHAVEITQVALGLILETLDAVYVIFLVGKQLQVINAKVFELREIKYIIEAVVIGLDDFVEFGFCS